MTKKDDDQQAQDQQAQQQERERQAQYDKDHPGSTQRQAGKKVGESQQAPPMKAAEPAGPHEQQKRLPGQPHPNQPAVQSGPGTPGATPETANPAGPGISANR